MPEFGGPSLLGNGLAGLLHMPACAVTQNLMPPILSRLQRGQ